MLRKTTAVLAVALALIGPTLSTTAFAADHGGGGHGGGFGGGHFGGSHGGGFGDGPRFGGGFHGGHFAHRDYYGGGFPSFAGSWGYDDWPYDDYAYSYDPSCYRLQRYHTKTGWHTRRVHVCQ